MKKKDSIKMKIIIFTFYLACAKTHVSDKKSPGSGLAKSEKTQVTNVNEYFSDKHNSLS